MANIVPMSGGGGIQVIPRARSDTVETLALIQALSQAGGQIAAGIQAHRAANKQQAANAALVDAFAGPADAAQAAAPSPGSPGPTAGELAASGGVWSNPTPLHQRIGGGAPTGLSQAAASPVGAPSAGLLSGRGLTRGQIEALVLSGHGDQLLAMTQPPKPVEVAAGASLVDPRTNQLLYQAPPKPAEAPNAVREAQALGFDLSTPEGQAGYSAWRQSLTRPPAPGASVTMPPMETARDRALGEATGGRLAAISEERVNNRRIRTSIGLLDNLIEGGISTGPGTSWRQTIRDVTGLELGDLSGADAFAAVANQLVLQAQTQQKGPQTDSDRQLIASTFPKIGTSDRANELVIDILEAQSRRLDEELTLERRLIERDGLTVSEAQDRVAQEFADRPIFGDDLIQQAQALDGGGAQTGTVSGMSLEQARAAAMDDEALARMSPEERAALAARLRAGR